MGNGMNKVLPGLYLGNFIDAKDLEQLSRNKITHIISIHESPQPLLQEITYLLIPLQDTPEANIKKHFKACIRFIHCCRLHGGNCLVHCLAGISRSTTLVIAYVMAVTELSWQEVLQAVRAVRPIANPNPGFKQQLEEFGQGAAQKIHRQLAQRYGADPFKDKEELRALLPADTDGDKGKGPMAGNKQRAEIILRLYRDRKYANEIATYANESLVSIFSAEKTRSEDVASSEERDKICALKS